MKISGRRPHTLKSLALQTLESRTNPSFVVTNTDDYDPKFYNKFDLNTYVIGSARWAIQKAMEAGVGEVVFDTTVDLDPGVGTSYFGGPINEYNTINLQYGEIAIKDEGYFNADPDFSLIEVHAPRFFDHTREYVKIVRTGTVDSLGNELEPEELSVVDIFIEKYPDVVYPFKAPVFGDYHPDFYHPDFSTKVAFHGLFITGGKSDVGAGINATGWVNLDITDCKIVNNNAFYPNDLKGTGGGGIAANPRHVPVCGLRGCHASAEPAGPNSTRAGSVFAATTRKHVGPR